MSETKLVQLRKKVVHDQIKVWMDLMKNRPEWSTVYRHLSRALMAAADLIGRK